MLYSLSHLSGEIRRPLSPPISFSPAASTRINPSILRSYYHCLHRRSSGHSAASVHCQVFRPSKKRVSQRLWKAGDMEAFVNSTKKKMKRKDVDQVSDDFSDFSLSSPARKIRRLDAELPPIMEDGEPDTFMSYEQTPPPPPPPPELQVSRSGPIIEELAPSLNEERAIVLFKPVTSPILQHQSSSTLSVSVDPNLISEFKNRNLWASLSGNEKSLEDDEEVAGKSTNKCTAVVPWYPNQYTPAPETQNQIEPAEEMEAEPMGEATMEIEDDCSAASVQELYKPSGEFRGSDSSGLPQWQYCMTTPQFPSTASSPVYWYR